MQGKSPSVAGNAGALEHHARRQWRADGMQYSTRCWGSTRPVPAAD